MSYGQFMNLNGRPAEYFYPAAGDTGIEGTIVSVTYGITGSGRVRADGQPGVANSGWQGAPTSGPLCTNRFRMVSRSRCNTPGREPSAEGKE
jgi:hypothetical protein